MLAAIAMIAIALIIAVWGGVMISNSPEVRKIRRLKRLQQIRRDARRGQSKRPESRPLQGDPRASPKGQV